ncbi:hypothetical protein HYV71_03380 [Candidatus Uhrbacteria bacterium]|nr:hypothetical protein [Candidatus Uhrbacteria bacterium]
MAFRPKIKQAGKAAPKRVTAAQRKELEQQKKQLLEKEVLEQEIQYRKGTVSLRDVIAPSSFEAQSSYIRIGSKFARTLFVLGYPRYIYVGWFAPIINYSASFDISIFLHPMPVQTVLKQLRDKVGRVEAEISMAQEHGKPRDPAAETALKDMEKLRDDLTQGTEHFFSLGLYVTLYADSVERLDKLTEDIEAIFGTKLVYTKRVFYQAEQGFNSTLPLGHDELEIGFNMNTSPAAASFPFISSDLTSEKGILYGLNRHNNSLILFDRFSLQNANSVVFATSGAGKSVERSTPVLLKDREGVKLVTIGEYIDSLGAARGFERIDDELEGICNPEIEVYTFDKNLKGEWSHVSIAARKSAPSDSYTFRTKSGREITTTADHNMLRLRNGQVVTAKSADITVGDSVPLPRRVTSYHSKKTSLNLAPLLSGDHLLYVMGASAVVSQFEKRCIGYRMQDPRYAKYRVNYVKGRRMPLTLFAEMCDALRLSWDDPLFRSIRICSRNRSDGAQFPLRLRLSAELGRILGYIVSEGTIGNNFVLITNQDDEVLQDIKDCLRSLRVPYFQRHDQTVVVSSRVFVSLIHAIRGGGKSHEKRIPSVIWDAPTHTQAAFLRAYFEGDGSCEHHSVNATSKSKELISDLSYLLGTFGIICRLHTRSKYAANTITKRRQPYYHLSLSGQHDLIAFRDAVGFVSDRKNALLVSVCNKEGNTNVWTIPVQDVFQELYTLIPAQLRGIQDYIDIKNGAYQPSRKKLFTIIQHIETAIHRFERYRKRIILLEQLPLLTQVITRGSAEKRLNGMLWSEMGQTWRIMKQQLGDPYAQTVLSAWSIVGQESIDAREARSIVHESFRVLGLSLNGFSRSLGESLRYRSDTRYTSLYDAAQLVTCEYRSISQRLPRVRALIARLKNLVTADLEWDPIVSVQQKKCGDSHVYDLTVDNEVFLAGHGAMFVHNSYAIKLEVLRTMMMGADVIVIDPEKEYQHLCEAVGGTYINISLASTSRINPFDLPRPVGEQVSTADIIRSAVITLKGLMRLMLGTLTPEEDSIVDRALIESYAKKDITAQTDLASAQPPTLQDLQDVLEGMVNTGTLVERLKKYTEGTFSGLLNRSTNVEMRNQLVVFSVRDLEDELRPMAIYTIVNYIWNVVRSQVKKRILVIDEAWWLMQHDDSARFVFALAKRCRKYYLGLTTITQDVNDFLNSQYGKAILTNSSIQLLLKQSTAAIDLIQKTFLLTEGEKYLLLESAPGEGIFFAGQKHVAIKIVASYSEDQLITTDPRQLLEIEAAKKEFAAEQEESQKS